jgi:hypothetical protein
VEVVGRSRVGPLAALLLAAGAAEASSVSDEISVASTQSTPQSPRVGNVSNFFSGYLDVADGWTANFSAQVTVLSATAAAPGSPGDRGGTVTSFSAGVDWEATVSWTFGATVELSPSSTIGSDVRVRVLDRPADVLVETTSSIASLGLLAAYDTAGDSDLEWSFSAGFDLSRVDSQQNAAASYLDDGTPVSPADLRAKCAAVRSGCRALVPAIDGTSALLRYARVAANATAIVAQDTDVGLDLDYYGYADDPVGILNPATAGRTGTSAPLAPLRFLVRLGATHRFGSFSLRGWVQAGEYVPEAGEGTASVGVKAQYKLSRAFRLWISATGQRDEDPTGAISRTGILALGAGYRF